VPKPLRQEFARFGRRRALVAIFARDVAALKGLGARSTQARPLYGASGKERLSMTMQRTESGWRPHLVPGRLLRSSNVHHPAVWEEAKRRNGDFWNGVHAPFDFGGFA
jgi:hypothetical protein